MLLYEKKVEDFHIEERTSLDFIPHIHHNIELLVCISGEFSVSCREQSRTLRRGDMMIAFSNDIHSYRKGGEGIGIMMIVNPQVLPLLSKRLQARRYENFLSGEGRNFVPIAEEILREYEGDGAREILVGYLYILLGTALKVLPHTEEKQRISTDCFSEVLEYLSAHYTEPISLKVLAKTFGVDPSCLSRMFSERLSYHYLTYLHMLRVEHAKNLLRSTDLKINDVIFESGFSDQKTFNRVFKELVNMTPKEYRGLSEVGGAI
ncbi:MAG: AraC family transcriptional regulator [Lachnospiraceae bacterium]|nr:AraC family transcriptional regulator [Lachnospiraceae bacterium]